MDISKPEGRRNACTKACHGGLDDPWPQAYWDYGRGAVWLPLNPSPVCDEHEDSPVGRPLRAWGLEGLPNGDQMLQPDEKTMRAALENRRPVRTAAIQ